MIRPMLFAAALSLGTMLMPVLPGAALADGPRGWAPPTWSAPTWSMPGHGVSAPVRAGIGALQGTWRVVAVHTGRRVLEPAMRGQTATLRIDEDGRLSASVGCNRIAGRIVAERRDRIAVERLRSTRMACPRPEARLEARLIEALELAARFDLGRGRLVLSDRAGRPLIELERQHERGPRPRDRRDW